MAQSALGLASFALLAWLLSENRRGAVIKGVAAGLAAQLAIGLLLVKLPGSRYLFLALNRGVVALEDATAAGTSFVFGYLGGGPLPFAETRPGASFILAFQALPLVLVIAALSALLFYWRILPAVVSAFAWALGKTLAVGGALGVVVSANVFLGMIESPLVIRPYLVQLTRSELFTMMTCGMAMIAGTVMVVYAAVLKGIVPDPIGQLLTASLISVPASITVARLMVPETGVPTAGEVTPPAAYRSAMDAIARGTADGIQLLINIIAFLIVLVALVALANKLLALLPAGGAPLTLEAVLGYVMAPVAWLMGIPWAEAGTAGSLLGKKIVLNEFLAYLDLATLPPGSLAERSKLIMTYALCGFANFGSLAIMVGGLGTLAPTRRSEVVSLGPRAIVSGTLSTCMTGAVIGILSAG